MTVSFSALASAVATAAGRPAAFLAAVGIVLVWAAFGPFYHYSEGWQIVINTGTTIITFLMVFLIQASQNRDGLAIQTKLDEIIRSSQARNEFAGIDERLSEEALLQLRHGAAL